jgi:hypothetical protein
MRIIQQIIICFFCLCGVSYAAITDYQPTFIPGHYQENLHIAIRTFYKDNEPFFLLVNPNTFDTLVIPTDQFFTRKETTTSNSVNKYYSWEKIATTPYITALMT